MPVYNVFKAIADPARQRILDSLRTDGPSNVVGLGARFRFSRQGLQQHLRVLERARLVKAEKVGRERRYELLPERLYEVFQWVCRYEKFWDDKLDSLEAVLNEEAAKTKKRGKP